MSEIYIYIKFQDAALFPSSGDMFLLYLKISFVVLFLASFPYFEKIEVGLGDHLAGCVSVQPPQSLKTLIVEPGEMVIASQWLIKHNSVATNIHSTTEKLMVLVFFMFSPHHKQYVQKGRQAFSSS